MGRNGLDMTELSEKELARIYMQARLLRCPLGNNPDNCPLHDIRLLPMDQRYDWLDRQSDDDVLQLFQHHNECVKRRLAEEP